MPSGDVDKGAKSTRRLADVVVTALSRRTSGRAVIAEIDGLRFLAIIAVVVFHANANFNAHTAGEAAGRLGREIDLFLRTGEFGVPLFFVISGFVLSLPFAESRLFNKRPVGLRRYFIRRLTRLEPPYLVALLFYFTFKTIRLGDLSLVDNLFASMVYSHNIVYGEPSAITVVAWSLEVEAQFYILAPLLTLVFCVRSTLLRRSVLVAAMIASSMAAQSLGVHSPIDGRTIAHQLGYFLAGFLLADLWLTRFQHDDSASWWGDAAAFAGIGGVFWLARAEWTPALFAPTLILIGYIGVIRGAISRTIFRNRWIVVFGGMCYTVYLFHFAIIGFLGKALSTWLSMSDASLAMRMSYMAIASAVVYALCVPAFVLIEKPAMDPKWPSKLWNALVRRIMVAVSR